MSNKPDEQNERSITYTATRRITDAAQEASRSNGKKGGRPKGIPQSAETREKIRQTKLAQSRPIVEQESSPIIER